MFIEVTDAKTGNKGIVNTENVTIIWGDCPYKEPVRAGILFMDGTEMYIEESYEEIRKVLNVHGMLR